jgi:hypothetical protein
MTPEDEGRMVAALDELPAPLFMGAAKPSRDEQRARPNL